MFNLHQLTSSVIRTGGEASLSLPGRGAAGRPGVPAGAHPRHSPRDGDERRLPAPVGQGHRRVHPPPVQEEAPVPRGTALPRVGLRGGPPVAMRSIRPHVLDR